MFLLRSFPRAILHVDGDAFFASCEVALNPKLKGKPVVTGQERGIVSAMTYEAKKLGISRGMRIFEVRKFFPSVIIVSSDYETYTIFSHRMFNIVRRYTPQVEEYSIDECFADLTGLRGVLHTSYENIALRIKHDLESELGLTFSIGVAPTKVLAKVASKWKKPSGFTIIPGRGIETFLQSISIDQVWGIGGQTSICLRKCGIETAFDFASRSEEWVKEKTNKAVLEIWHELRGTSVSAVSAGSGEKHKSIQKTRTFTPATNDRSFIFSQLSKNVENACRKARQHRLVASEISFFLKTQDFRYFGRELKLSLGVNTPETIIKAVEAYFDEVYYPGVLYRASGITLRKLVDAEMSQSDLFGQSLVAGSFSTLYKELDHLSQKFGRNTVFLGSSLRAMKQDGRSVEKRLVIPCMGDVS